MISQGKTRNWIIRECRDRSDLERLFRFRCLENVEKRRLLLGAAARNNRLLGETVDACGADIASPSVRSSLDWAEWNAKRQQTYKPNTMSRICGR